MEAKRQLTLPFVDSSKEKEPSSGLQGSAKNTDIEGGSLTSLASVRASVRVRAGELADSLRRRLGYGVKVFITDNRSSLVTARWDSQIRCYIFRVHHMFLDADEGTVDALSDFGSGRRKKSAGLILDAYINANRQRIRKDPAAGPRAPAPPKGRHHDLQAIFDDLNEEYFNGQVVARIGWGESRGHGRRRRSIKMGSYVHDARLIRVHPALDRSNVPGYYVAWVVYHEMLHQVVPPVKRGNKTIFHSAKFRRLEVAYKEAARAKVWEDNNIEILLRG